MRSLTPQVVVDQLALGDRSPGKDHPVGMGDAHAVDLDRLVVPGRVDGDHGEASARSPPLRWVWPTALAGRRVGASTGISRTTSCRLLSLRSPLNAALADVALVGPAAELDLGDQLRLDEMRPPPDVGGTSSAGGVLDRALLQLRPELVELALAEAAADPAAIDQPVARRGRRAGSTRTAAPSRPMAASR